MREMARNRIVKKYIKEGKPTEDWIDKELEIIKYVITAFEIFYFFLNK